MFGTERIPDLERKIDDLQHQVTTIDARLRGLVRHGMSNRLQLDDYYSSLLTGTTSLAKELTVNSSAHQSTGWELEPWVSWTPPIWSPDDPTGSDLAVPSTLLRTGELIEGRRNGDLKFRVPAFVPFVGQDKTVMIKTRPGAPGDGLGLLQSLLVRSALMLPHQTAYALLDPAGNGAAFPMRRHLPQVQENSGDVRRDLDRLIQHIQRINETFLDASTPSFEKVEPILRINERFQLVFAADFPNKYDRRAIEALQSVATTGPRAGVYVFIHYNSDYEMPRDLNISDFKNAWYIDLSETISLSSCNLGLKPDLAPEPKVQELVFEKLRAAKPPERRVDWSTIAPSDEWWTHDATESIATPIGVSGATGTLGLWFGMNQEGQPCAHGMLGAMTGAGKSNLYHVLILGLAVRYSPNELRLFLIDGKDGVEFQPYRDLPHAEVVSLKSSPQLSRSVLAELVAERERRNKIFSETKVTDLTQYRRNGQPRGNLPRILLLVDEYQELFEGDKDGEASNLLLQLAQQGRSAGIHMLLGSQRFGAAGMLNQTAIFGNIHLRMAMQMTNSDIMALTEFGRRGKQLILTCDLPGKIVVNDRSGDDSGNQVGKVAYLRSDQRKQLIDQLIARARETLAPKEVPVTVIFDGKAQPNLIENPHVQYLMHQPGWLSDQEFETVARRPVYEEGLGISDWFSAEHPKVVWMGQDFSVRGQAMAVVRRRTAEHILVIGGANASRYGVLAACIASLALNSSPQQVQFIVLDRSIPGTAWHDTLDQVLDLVIRRPGYTASMYKNNSDAEVVLGRLRDELDRRSQLDETARINEPAVFVVMTDLDRVDDLRRKADMYGTSETPLGQIMNRICVEGSALGIHLILSFSGVRPMSHVIDERRGLLHFRHRVALQMSEDESLTFVRSRRAAQLQTEGATPVCALYLDLENDRNLRFKPYSIEATIDFREQLQEIGQRVAAWSELP